MRWIREHKLFSIVATIVLALILVIIVSYLSGGGTAVVGSSVNKIVTTIEKPLSGITNGIKNVGKGIFKYQDVLDENEKLKEENAELEKRNIELKLKSNELAQLKTLSDAFKFTPFVGVDKAVAGRIIAIDNSNVYKVFTIDAGADKGIKKNGIVVDGKGLVGKIKDVHAGTSKVISVLDSKNKISFKVLRKPSIMGVVKGNGKEQLEGYLMDEKARIVKGDVLVTSGIGIYPEGIKIGKVSEVNFDSDTQLKVIKVTPTVDFDSLQKVAIFI
ncbi:MAG: rod shape-determining protein MreC [Anaerovoracaceae bacterium]